MLNKAAAMSHSAPAFGGAGQWCDNARVIPRFNPAVFLCWRWRKPAA